MMLDIWSDLDEDDPEGPIEDEEDDSLDYDEELDGDEDLDGDEIHVDDLDLDDAW